MTGRTLMKAWLAIFGMSVAVCAAQTNSCPDRERRPVGVDSKKREARVYRSLLNVPYAKISGVRPHLLSLDIYLPLTPLPSGAPVVIMVHGGGWRAGDKATGAAGREKAVFFAANGFIYVSVNYRLSPEVQHPVPVSDVARAVAWVAGNIKRHGGDPERISLMGHSAGAHLAALVAVDERHLGALGQSPSLLRGVILLDSSAYDISRNLGFLAGGRFDRTLYESAFGKDPAVWADASPMRHVHPGKSLPRFLIFHTDRRLLGPGSREFARAIRRTGAPAAAVFARGKTHATLHHDIGEAGDGPSQLILDFLGGANSFPDSI